MNTFMGSPTQSLDLFFFIVLPYTALAVFLLATINRYRTRPFTYSSLSSQFLENQQHFWVQVSFHYGILILLLGHLIAFLFPRQVLLWNSRPLRLYVLEISAFIFAVLTLVGLLGVILRRTAEAKVRVITSATDWILSGLLLFQVLTGIDVAVFYGWGSSWFAATLTPYLWSLLRLSPDIRAIAPLPWMVKVHIIGTWIILGFFPFTRLVHILVAPIPYLWRRPQVVRWNRTPGTARKSR